MVSLPLKVSGSETIPMLYLAKFAAAVNPVLVGAADAEKAAARVFELTGSNPATLDEIPDEMCCCELRMTGDSEPEEDNPADGTESGVALDPFDDFAAWLEAIEGEPMPAALAQTEPPATEPAPDGV